MIKYCEISYGIEVKINSSYLDSVINKRPYSDSELEQLLDNVKPGDFIQLKRRTTSNAHSEIVKSIDPEGNNITIFDANTDGRNTVMVYTHHYFNNGSRLSFRNWNQGVSVYRFKKYIIDNPTPPTNLQISTNKKAYAVGEEVTFSFSSDGSSESHIEKQDNTRTMVLRALLTLLMIISLIGLSFLTFLNLLSQSIALMLTILIKKQLKR